MLIYIIHNLINEKNYIGKTKNIKNRWERHIYLAKCKVNRHLYNAMNKYGYENFNISILEECEDYLQDDREKYWIKYYNSNFEEYGYNMTIGGEGGNTWENNPHKEITGFRISIMNTGKKRTREFKNRMKEIANDRAPMSQETKDKISKTRTKAIEEGYINIEHCGDYMRGRTGKLHHFYGKNHSEQSKEKMKKARIDKTYEQIYGEEKAKEIKETKSNNFKDENNINYIHVDKEKLKILVLYGCNNKIIAEFFNVSPSTIIEKFKKYFNMTPTEFRAIYNIKLIKKESINIENIL